MLRQWKSSCAQHLSDSIRISCQFSLGSSLRMARFWTGERLIYCRIFRRCLNTRKRLSTALRRRFFLNWRRAPRSATSSAFRLSSNKTDVLSISHFYCCRCILFLIPPNRWKCEVLVVRVQHFPHLRYFSQSLRRRQG